MTYITGNGYGDKHHWKRFDTIQSNNRFERGTFYKCDKCEVYFRHYYHITSNIFDAMEELNIPEECI